MLGFVNHLISIELLASDDDASRLERCYFLQANETLFVDSSINPFSLFIFDDADFNVNTLDAHDKFHEMGGIIVTVSPSPTILGPVSKVSFE